MLRHSPDAEDACQDALLAIATRIGSWNGRGRFTTWMHVLAMNAARSAYRRMRSQAVVGGVAETLDRHHPQYVEPLLLRDVYGLPYEEIAQQVDAPLGTVKARIHHGRRLVRPLLRGDG